MIARKSPIKKAKDVEVFRGKAILCEGDLQECQVAWLKDFHPEILVYASQNGSKLGGNPVQRARMVNAAKRRGFKAGWPDLTLLANVNGDARIIFIENKFGKNTQEDSQIDVQAQMKSLGFDYVLCNSFKMFKMIVEVFMQE